MIFEDSAVINVSDNNIFFGNHSPEFSINGLDYDTFSDYQTATAFDLNSQDKDIDFVDMANGDFHLTPTQYEDTDLITAVINGVIYDVDGDLRNQVTPLIGADELDTDLIFSHSFEAL
jgi:hypothetical protein